MSKQAYQVILYLGNNLPVIEGVSVVDITPKDTTLESISYAISQANLTAADMRAKTLLVIDGISIEMALSVYSLILGFAARRINISVNGEIIDAATLNHFGLISKDGGKPSEPAEYIILKNSDFKEELPIDFITQLRYAKRCLLPLDTNLKETLEIFIRAAGIRIRNNGDHLPTLSKSSNANEEDESLIIDTNSFRKLGNELRRMVKTDDRGAIVRPGEVTPRDLNLEKAAKLPIEIALQYLGSYVDETGEFWRCPRPERHRNGDLNPSMKISEEKVRCYRCDLESIDGLRLIMDSLDVTPDEASKIILSELI